MVSEGVLKYKQTMIIQIFHCLRKSKQYLHEGRIYSTGNNCQKDSTCS